MMTTYRCSDPDHLLVAIADLQADHGRPLDAARLHSVRQAMGGGVPLPAVILQRWKAISFLIDGWHRLCVAVELGLTHLPARLLPPP
jgi:hypothetical protein